MDPIQTGKKERKLSSFVSIMCQRSTHWSHNSVIIILIFIDEEMQVVMRRKL